MSQFQPGNPGGPGRPRKANSHAGAVARAEKKIVDRLPWLVDQMLELATGVLVEEPDKGGLPTIYQRPPDYKAIAYLIDRIMGKPTERKEITGADGGPLKGYMRVNPDDWGDEPPTE